MALQDPIAVEACLLELAVDVGCEYKGTVRQAFTPVTHHPEAVVRRGGAVEFEAVAVEAEAEAEEVVADVEAEAGDETEKAAE